MRLEYISCSGDQQTSWYFVRQLLTGFDFSEVQWDHHMARFGVHWVSAVVQSLFGASPFTYYIPPLFASVTCTVLVYLLGYRVASRTVGVLAALFFITFSPFDRASSQLRTEIFEMVYMTGSSLFLVAYRQSDNRRARINNILGCSILLFLAYMSKIHCLFFLPGIVIVMGRSHRNAYDLLLFLGVLLALFFVETMLLNIISPHAHRLEIISSAHLRLMEERGRPRFDTLWDLTKRLTDKLSNRWKPQIYCFFASSLVIMAWRRLRKNEAMVVPMVILPASFLFFLTFLVRDIDPIRLLINTRSRYLSVAMPFVFIVNAVVLTSLVRLFIERLPVCNSLLIRFARFFKPAVAATAICALVIHTFINTKDDLRLHPFIEAARLQSLLNDTYRRKLPIISEYDRRPTRAVSKGLYWALKTFIDDDLLVQDGVLPQLSVQRDVVWLERGRGFIPKTKGLTRSKVKHMLEHNKECVLVLTRIKIRFIRTSTLRSRLPAHCKTL